MLQTNGSSISYYIKEEILKLDVLLIWPLLFLVSVSTWKTQEVWKLGGKNSTCCCWGSGSLPLFFFEYEISKKGEKIFLLMYKLKLSSFTSIMQGLGYEVNGFEFICWSRNIHFEGLCQKHFKSFANSGLCVNCRISF